MTLVLLQDKLENVCIWEPMRCVLALRAQHMESSMEGSLTIIFVRTRSTLHLDLGLALISRAVLTQTLSGHNVTEVFNSPTETTYFTMYWVLESLSMDGTTQMS